MKSYVVVYEKAGDNYSAYAPDLPGCIACGDTIPETERLMKEAIRLYIDALREEGQPAPEPSAQVSLVDVA